MELDPTTMRIRDIYGWMVGLITPRPIAWVSTLSPNGNPNLAPYSFFNGVGANPPLVMFCPANRRDGTPKDTLANVQRTGEFVVNLVTESVVEAMNITSGEYAPDVDEFEVANMDKAPSTHVKAPRVAACFAALECVLHQAIQFGTGPGGANLVVGRIVGFYIDDLIVDEEQQLIVEQLDTVGRMGGSGYVQTNSRFTVPRPS